MIQSENSLLRGTVLFNVRGRDLGSTVKDAQDKINESIKKLPKGYFIDWSGQYENQIHAAKTLKIIVPIVLLIILLVLYMVYKSVREAFFSLITVPFALIGGVYMIFFYDVNLSVAVAVGFIALFGVAVLNGIVLISYYNSLRDEGEEDLLKRIYKGSAARLRPILATATVAS